MINDRKVKNIIKKSKMITKKITTQTERTTFKIKGRNA